MLDIQFAEITNKVERIEKAVISLQELQKKLSQDIAKTDKISRRALYVSIIALGISIIGLVPIFRVHVIVGQI